MTTVQVVVETSVTVNTSSIQDYVHPDDHAPRTFWVQTFHSMTSLDKDSLFISSSTQMFALISYHHV